MPDPFKSWRLRQNMSLNLRLSGALAASLLVLGACDQVRIPGVNPVGEETSAPASTGDAAHDTASDTANDTASDAGGETANDPSDDVADASDTETDDGAANETVTVDVPAGDGSDTAEATDPAPYDPTDTRTPADIAGITDGEQYVQEGVIYRNEVLDDGSWQTVELGPAPEGTPDGPYGVPGDAQNDPEAETDTAEPGTQAPRVSLASLNAVTCGLAPTAAPTPTVGMVAGATAIEEPMVGAAAVNANAAVLANFPGIVKMEPRTIEGTSTSSGHCGATRISASWFITAAHCVDEAYSEIRFITGAESLRSPLARIAMAGTAVCHGGYGGVENGYANDVALIKVPDAQLEVIADVPIAKVAQTQLPLAPINYPLVEMAGWGLTRYGGQLSNDLLTTQLELTNAGPALLTVASQSGAGPCIGDSGGPLYITEADGTKTVVGVLSVVEQNRQTGEFCAGDYNGRYTNLQGYTDWIASVTQLCDTDPEMCQ